jgi:predicted transcriptional regulator
MYSGQIHRSGQKDETACGDDPKAFRFVIKIFLKLVNNTTCTAYREQQHLPNKQHIKA